ncbi:Sodium-coupled monocarboxylate transporter 1 [Frankliniella fusca]|uniref:Sodium-coupled monocarboxylate transporter 1 n=1 Tax=Frankliniella fusca TaxID=407009 RepID=A0AAE1H493_9NEOP|nr:Sodium-coupled monocarboxylate transporter 1 [Frankliniella fusca]
MGGDADVVALGEALQRFSWPDYLVFVAMLALCALIGVYFGYLAPGAHDEDEYLMGGRQMKTLPISLSLVASYISGITLLGMPTEVYVYGIQFLYGLLGMAAALSFFAWAILPIFHDLRIMTLYQYLQMRFDRRVRMSGSVFFTISMITWLPIVIYVPALAFNQVTGINIHFVTPAVCTVCVFYTCVGGMKAVVWTDVVQTVSMMACILLVAYKGTVDVGGFALVVERGLQSGRIEEPVWQLDPFLRHTAWACALGNFCFSLVSCGMSQSMTQRYLALPSLAKARRSVFYFLAGCWMLFTVCAYCGLLIHATYHECDPVTTKPLFLYPFPDLPDSPPPLCSPAALLQLARAKDQVLPLLVMETLGMFPGLPGLFVAGVFSAALSSLSTGLNSMAAVVVEDFWRPLASAPLSEAAVHVVMRVVVVAFGALCVALVFVVEHLGAVLQLSASLNSISAGPVLAVFVAGAFLPWVNATGCLAGAAAGLSFMAWMVLGAQHAIAHGRLSFPELPRSVANCSYAFNATGTSEAAAMPLADLDPPMWLYRFSYQLYPVLGLAVSLCVSLAVSLLCRPPAAAAPALDPRLFSPLVRGLIKTDRKVMGDRGTHCTRNPNCDPPDNSHKMRSCCGCWRLMFQMSDGNGNNCVKTVKESSL